MNANYRVTVNADGDRYRVEKLITGGWQWLCSFGTKAEAFTAMDRQIDLDSDQWTPVARIEAVEVAHG